MSVNRNKKSITAESQGGRGPSSCSSGWSARATWCWRTSGRAPWSGSASATSALAKLNPRLVYCAISGFGESGPESHRAGYDLIVQAESGIMDITGFEDGAAGEGRHLDRRPRGRHVGGPRHHAGAAGPAPDEARPEGRDLDARRHGGAADLPGRHLLRHRHSARRGAATSIPSIVPYEVFKAADAYLTLGVANNSLWERCCAAIGACRPDQGSALRHGGRPRAESRGAGAAASTRCSARGRPRSG